MVIEAAKVVKELAAFGESIRTRDLAQRKAAQEAIGKVLDAATSTLAKVSNGTSSPEAVTSTDDKLRSLWLEAHNGVVAVPELPVDLSDLCLENATLWSDGGVPKVNLYGPQSADLKTLIATSKSIAKQLRSAKQMAPTKKATLGILTVTISVVLVVYAFRPVLIGPNGAMNSALYCQGRGGLVDYRPLDASSWKCIYPPDSKVAEEPVDFAQLCREQYNNEWAYARLSDPHGQNAFGWACFEPRWRHWF
jgi:hypothetical protein